MKLEKNKEFERRSRAVIAGGALTNSKRPESFVKGVYPTHIKSGKDCYLFDVDGNRFVDYICALGSNLLGYANREIDLAVRAQLEKGTVYSLGSDLEVEVAEKLQGYFPFLERMRFLKTGSEACAAAVRIARAYQQSKRKIVVVR